MSLWLQVTYLIDPNDANNDQLVEVINKSAPSSVWVGCSVSSGQDVRRALEQLSVPAKLFPGTIEQILMSDGVVQEIVLPIPLHPINQTTGALRSRVMKIIPNLKSPIRRVSYVLLNVNCTAARILGLSEAPSMETIMRDLEAEKPEHIYVEGGSRSESGISYGAIGLMAEVRRSLPNAKIIYGWGIRDPDDVYSLDGLADEVIVSHAIHENPDRLHQFLDLETR